jgi:nucleoside triphosphate diphosphatase
MQIERLLAIMARLRDPERGCAWDREQTWSTIAPHTLEEAYELADAVTDGDPVRIRDELGDVLFQVVFQARIAEELGEFAFDDVAKTISDKLERRHPHVFGAERIDDPAVLRQAWETQKAAERASTGQGSGALDGIARALPALARAEKLGKRAARVGFDWPDLAGVLAKIREEIDELEGAAGSADSSHVREELGDLLFSLAQAARRLDIDAEGALRDANAKFARRFRHVEAALQARGLQPSDVELAELESLWGAAKKALG